MASGSCRAALANSPNITMVSVVDVPPEEIIGSCRPVTGSRAVT